MKRGIFIICIGLALAIHAAPNFVTPAMMRRNGLTDKQYQLLWNLGKNPKIDIATARDWIFRASRYANVVEWLEICGKTNDFAKLSYKLQEDNFAFIETNRVLAASVRKWRKEAKRWEVLAEEWMDSATNNAARVERVKSSLDKKRAEYVDKFDKSIVPTTKAIYQSFIDSIDRIKKLMEMEGEDN